MIGEKIIDYQILELLGEGGMGVVYVARDLRNNREVAFKMLKLEFVGNSKIRKRFLAEAENLKKLSHDNVVRVFDTIDAGDVVAFAMEKIDGVSLEKLIKNEERLSNDKILNYLGQILSGLKHCHERGLIHRDIKPSNIMLTLDGCIKLLDFGISKNLENSKRDITQTTKFEIMGTLGYMSPEQLKSTKDVSVLTDIYSLGVVLWEMVEGRKLYNSNLTSEAEIKAAILQNPLPLTHTNWDHHIQKACSKNENKRFQNCTEWKNSLIESDEDTKFDFLRVKVNATSNWMIWLSILILILTGTYLIFSNYLYSESDSFIHAQHESNQQIEEISIDGKIWMQFNLKTTKFNDGESILEVKNKEEWIKAAENQTPAFCYYNFDEKTKDQYGVYYNYFALLDPRGIVPVDYVIPTIKELSNTFKNNPELFSKNGLVNMKGEFISVGENAMYWSNSVDNNYLDKAMMLLYAHQQVSEYPDLKGMGLSVRCRKLEVVEIGNYTWMAENLNVNHFRNGDPIPVAKSVKEWEEAGKKGQAAWCYYENDSELGLKYGKLYNYYAVNDPRGLAPYGWHVSTNEEWRDLMKITKDGNSLKSKSDWMLKGAGSDIFGFKALPGGYRSSNGGEFKDRGFIGIWYTSTLNDGETAKKWHLVYDNMNLQEGYQNFKGGFSIRCVKDSIL